MSGKGKMKDNNSNNMLPGAVAEGNEGKGMGALLLQKTIGTVCPRYLVQLT